MVFAVPLLDKFKVDDVVGAIPAHLVCGIWGTLVVPLSNSDATFGVQLLGVVAIGAFVSSISAIFWLAMVLSFWTTIGPIIVFIVYMSQQDDVRKAVQHALSQAVSIFNSEGDQRIAVREKKAGSHGTPPPIPVSHDGQRDAQVKELTGGDDVHLPTEKEPTSAPVESTADTPEGSDKYDEIERLADLHKKGFLTDDEFTAKKSQLLGLSLPSNLNLPKDEPEPKGDNDGPTESRE